MFVSVYISSNLGLPDFNAVLDELSGALSNRVDKLIIGGDFNSKASLWGSRQTNSRGRLFVEWAVERDLRIANIGNTPTCVRWQGSSIVDITWTSSDLLSHIGDWHVGVDIESLSDYLYVLFLLSSARSRPLSNRPMHRKWNQKKCDWDFFSAVFEWRGCEPDVEDRNDVKSMITWLDQIVEEAYDAATSRIGPR